jgi:hypothetical protein
VKQAVHIIDELLHGRHIKTILFPSHLLDNLILNLRHISLGRIITFRRVTDPNTGNEEVERHDDEENEEGIQDTLDDK